VIFLFLWKPVWFVIFGILAVVTKLYSNHVRNRLRNTR
jgi:hypothetical protein